MKKQNADAEHVLIVDDILLNLQVTAQILKDAGFRFSLAQNGQSALECLETETPDLILLDIMMPDINGLELCRTIKKTDRLKDVPIIFLTAKTQNEDLLEGFKAGGVDYLMKPFNREELLVRVKTHVELNRSRKKIMEMMKTRDKLYSIIAHDIRSPFASISFAINALAGGHISPSSDEFMDIVKHIGKSSQNTLSLINNLLEWSKFQGGSMMLQPRKNLILPLINECLSLLQDNASDKSISIDVSISSEASAWFDEVSIQTVFRNLISNAIKFTSEGGKIMITSYADDQQLKTIFKDTGVGISPHVQELIFQENGHYTSSGTKNELGTGLGLKLVRDFVAQNQGQLLVESEEGVGSVFTICLPLNES